MAFTGFDVHLQFATLHKIESFLPVPLLQKLRHWQILLCLDGGKYDLWQAVAIAVKTCVAPHLCLVETTGKVPATQAQLLQLKKR